MADYCKHTFRYHRLAKRLLASQGLYDEPFSGNGQVPFERHVMLY
jgi:hypothetical protein